MIITLTCHSHVKSSPRPDTTEARAKEALLSKLFRTTENPRVPQRMKRLRTLGGRVHKFRSIYKAKQTNAIHPHRKQQI
jgi:hypothetical protein